MWDWLHSVVQFIRDIWPETIYDWHAVAATLGLLASVLFVALYSTVRWWKTNTGQNLMAMAVCIALLASGAVVRRLIDTSTGHVILLMGWTLVAGVMIWRTIHMWQLTHPKNSPEPPTPVSPSGDQTGRQWYSPTPNSILEEPVRKDR